MIADSSTLLIVIAYDIIQIVVQFGGRAGDTLCIVMIGSLEQEGIVFLLMQQLFAVFVACCIRAPEPSGHDTEFGSTGEVGQTFIAIAHAFIDAAAHQVPHTIGCDAGLFVLTDIVIDHPERLIGVGLVAVVAKEDVFEFAQLCHTTTHLESLLHVIVRLVVVHLVKVAKRPRQSQSDAGIGNTGIPCLLKKVHSALPGVFLGMTNRVVTSKCILGIGILARSSTLEKGVDTLIEQVDMLLEHEHAEEGLARFLVRTYPGEGFLHHFIKAVLVKQFEVRQHSIYDLTIYDLTIYD